MGEAHPRTPGDDPDPDLESSAVLLFRARAGDECALNALFARYRPTLLRLARGRLPAAARDLTDSADLVQETMLRAIKHVDTFDHKGEGAFLWYLRKILDNLIRDEGRRAKRHPAHVPLRDEFADGGRNPLSDAIDGEVMEAYETALAQLPAGQQQAVFLRVELGYSHQEVADALNRSSAGAARMLVVRGLQKLAELMQRERGEP